jgi:hypothetical protein
MEGYGMRFLDSLTFWALRSGGFLAQMFIRIPNVEPCTKLS